jgi:SAM-dependent methyltransferase
MYAMKASMSGQKISFRYRIKSLLDSYRVHRSGAFGVADQEIGFYDDLSGTFTKWSGRDIQDARVLDLGCGQRATQMAMFRANGAIITGIDMEIPTYQMNWRIFFQVMRKNGLERAVKSLIRHLLFDKRFFRDLSSRYGKTISLNDLDIRIMDASRLDFNDNTFDFIYSSWVLEHVENVDAVLREMNRVLKTGGVALIGIHLFPSLSGGHNLEWINPETAPSGKVPPWDHLLNSRYQASAFLNKYTLMKFRQSFSSHLRILEEKVNQEGHSFLTAELEKLGEKGYTREDLLTRSVFFTCGKNNTKRRSAR